MSGSSGLAAGAAVKTLPAEVVGLDLVPDPSHHLPLRRLSDGFRVKPSAAVQSLPLLITQHCPLDDQTSVLASVWEATARLQCKHPEPAIAAIRG